MRSIPPAVKLIVPPISFLILAALVAAAFQSRRLSAVYEQEANRIGDSRKKLQDEISLLEHKIADPKVELPELSTSAQKTFVERRTQDVLVRKELVKSLYERERGYRTAASRLWPGHIASPRAPLDEGAATQIAVSYLASEFPGQYALDSPGDCYP
jgi:hypothetical protein